MTVKPSVAARLAAVFLALAALTSPVLADDFNKVERSDEPSFLKRYTSGVQDLIIKGLEFVGVRYVRGGSNPDSGLDCSGFVRYVFQESVGLVLPRTAKEMSQVGQQVADSDLKPGDLVFFNTLNRSYSHVGIYIGDDRFVHAPSTNGRIRIDSLGARYYAERFEAARSYFD